MDLKSALAARRKYVDSSCDSVEGTGVSTADLRGSPGTAGMRFTPRSDTGYAGLENQGATCYLNSLLQSLFMIPDFRRVIYTWKYDSAIHGEEQFCCTRQLQRLFAQLQLTIRGAVTTANLTRSFGWTGAESFVQHDVQECMTVLFDFMTTQCFDSELGLFLSENVMGESFNELSCTVCGNSRQKAENFRDIQLQVRDENSLLGSLSNYLKIENIDGVECNSSTCNGQRNLHSSRVGIHKLPGVLIVQMRRFDINYENMQRIKLNDQIHFPLNFDTRETVLDADFTEYELLSILVHMGSAYAGHYFAYIKDLRLSGGDQSDSWLLFNDASVSRLDVAQVKYILGESVNNVGESVSVAGESPSNLETKSENASTSTPVRCAGNAYMLIYRKISPTNINNVPDELIPQDLLEEVAANNSKYLELKAKHDEERAFLNLQIMFGGITKLIRIHESSSVKELTDLAHASFHSAQIPPGQIQDSVTIDTGKRNIPASQVSLTALRDCVRLRVYDAVKGIMLPAAIFGDDATKSLKSFPESVLNKKFQFEIRDSATHDFESNSRNGGIAVFVVPFRSSPSNNNSSSSTGIDGNFMDPVQVIIPVESSLNDVHSIVARVASAQLHKMLSKDGECSAGISGNIRVVIVIVDAKSGMPILIPASDLCVNTSRNLVDGARLFVQLQNDESKLFSHVKSDESTVVDSDESSDLFQYFLRLRSLTSITCSVNTADRDLEIVEGHRVFQISILQSESVLCFKEKVAAELQVELNSFSIHKGKHQYKNQPSRGDIATVTSDSPTEQKEVIVDMGPGSEIKDLSSTIAAVGLEDGCDVEICFGTPLSVDQYRVAIFSEQETAAGNRDFQLLSEVIVRRADTVKFLKDTIRENSDSNFGNLRLRLGEIALNETFQSICNLYYLQKYKKDCGYKIKATNSILIDEMTLSDAIKNLGDGTCIVCQMNVTEKEYNHDDILLNIQYWDIPMMKLQHLGDFVMRKNAKFIELKETAVTIFQYYIKQADPQISQAFNPSDILLLKALAWQLSDVSVAVSSMKWRNQPSSDSVISLQPLRLVSGNTVLICLVEMFNLAYPVADPQPGLVASEGDKSLADKASNADARPFRMFSAQEQSLLFQTSNEGAANKK